MKKIVFPVLVMSMLLLNPSVFAQDKPAEPPEGPAGSSQATGRRFDNLSPEEQAKLREKWQTMSAEDKGKIRDQVREHLAARDAQGQMHRDIMSMELARLQEQHRTSVGELEAIRQIALKENARQTAEALARLIATQEKRYGQQIRALQRRLKMLQLQQDARSGVPGQTQTNKPPTPEPKKEDPKPQGTEPKP